LRRKSALTGRIAALIWVGQWPVWAVCDLGPWAIRQMLRRIRGRQRAQSRRIEIASFAHPAFPSSRGMRNPYRNAAEEEDVGAIRSRFDRGYDRVADWGPIVPISKNSTNCSVTRATSI
ncbi:MAG: hypothetical protein ABJO67_15420, partial [Pseudoruegeria sp.]